MKMMKKTQTHTIQPSMKTTIHAYTPIPKQTEALTHTNPYALNMEKKKNIAELEKDKWKKQQIVILKKGNLVFIIRADVLLSCICQALSHEYCDVCERNLCSEINKIFNEKNVWKKGKSSKKLKKKRIDVRCSGIQ